jgi:cytochrome c553
VAERIARGAPSAKFRFAKFLHMSIVINTLSDEDINNLAAYYSAIEVTVGKGRAGSVA